MPGADRISPKGNLIWENKFIPKMAFVLPKIARLLPSRSVPKTPSPDSKTSTLLRSSPSSSSPPLRDSAQDKPAAVQDKPGPAQISAKKKRDEFHLNVGIAVRTLREDIPALFYRDLDYDIFRFLSRISRVRVFLFLFKVEFN